jgi:HK97 family phage major capsid protein
MDPRDPRQSTEYLKRFGPTSPDAARRIAAASAMQAADPDWIVRGSAHYRDSWGAVSSDAYRQAWEAWLKAPAITGRGATDANQRTPELLIQVKDWQETRAALGVGSGAIGGFTVPPGFLDKLTVALRRSSSMIRAATVVDLDAGEPLQWPATDDTANSGAILAEGTAATETDPTFTSKALGAFMYTSNPVRLSYQLASDAFPQFVDYLALLLLGRRIARAFNAHATNGTGAGAQPTGLIPNASTGVTFAVGNTATYTYDGLVDLIASVDPEYLEPLDEPGPGLPGSTTLGPHVGWMTSVLGLQALRKVKDTAQAPIVTEGRPVLALGWPVLVNRDMPVPAANAKSIAFGNFGAGYVIRRSLSDVTILKLVERFADQLQQQVIGFQRLDGVPDDAGAVKLGVNSAS